MARKGNQKVRTGCFTCKIRKIKCDEEKPSCHRCTSTGRKCDGYPPRPQGIYSWNELLNAPVVAPPTVRLDDQEGRALEFFRRVVAPTLSGHSSPYFWTQLVSQLGQNEAVIRHAAVAISSLYEHSEDLQLNLIDSPSGQFAISHYNMALKQLRSNHQSEAVVIFACILFICIEILQNNRDAAIDHCKHGVMILNASTSRSSWARTHLLPVLLRLSIFPFFFGRTADTFPCIGDVSLDIPPSFAGLDDCRLALDSVTSRSMRFVRSVNTITPSPSVYLVQRSLAESLQSWRQAFGHLMAATKPSSDILADLLILQMKYLVSKIWLDVCLEASEMAYDRHAADFQELLDLAQKVLASKPAKVEPPRRPKFIFEMGFLPLLYFVVTRCRVLAIRIEALRAMMALSARRENLFDSRLMRGIGRRSIEIEHKVKLGRPGIVLNDSELPRDEIRIRDAVVTADTDTRLNEYGQSMLYKRVCFLGWAPDGGVSARNEWVEITINSEPELLLEVGEKIDLQA